MISDWPVSNVSNTLEARVKPPLRKLSLFDAVPFLTSPHFAAPRLFCVVAAEREGKKQGKEIMKLNDGLANVACAITGPACLPERLIRRHVYQLSANNQEFR
jgi:hypothetical protein